LKVGVGAGAALGLPRLVSAEEAAIPGKGPLGFFETVAGRRSVRQYKPTPVPDEHLARILDAGRQAPTAGNEQPWRFLVVRDEKKVERIKQQTLSLAEEFFKSQGITASGELEARKAGMMPYLNGILSAPLYVVVLVDRESKYPDYAPKDGILAAGQIMLAARALGYGTVFLTDGVPEEASKRALEIPDRYERIAMIPIGVPDAETPSGWPASPPKKRLEEVVAYETLD
jgi:nitroreductase